MGQKFTIREKKPDFFHVLENHIDLWASILAGQSYNHIASVHQATPDSHLLGLQDSLSFSGRSVLGLDANLLAKRQFHYLSRGNKWRHDLQTLLHTGITSLFERHLKDQNPHLAQLSYDIKDLFTFVDQLVNIPQPSNCQKDWLLCSCLQEERTHHSFLCDFAWISERGFWSAEWHQCPCVRPQHFMICIVLALSIDRS